MKNIIFSIFDNPRWYNTLIFSAKNFSDKKYNVYVVHKKTKRDSLGKIDFGKKTLFYPVVNFFFFEYFFFFSIKF